MGITWSYEYEPSTQRIRFLLAMIRKMGICDEGRLRAHDYENDTTGNARESKLTSSVIPFG
jgi:hypothetical protein